MRMPLVSVIVTSFNGHDTLPNAVLSALSQSYQNLEVIVLDDASDPPLKDTINHVDHNRVTLFRFNKNQGPYAGRDFAIRKSHGEIIAILDDDDVWLPDKIATQVPDLLAFPDTGLVCSGAVDIYPVNRRMTRLPPCRKISHERLLTREWIINSSVVFRRSTYNEVGGYDISMRRCGDWDFHIRISRDYSVVAIRKALVITYMNPGSQQRSGDICNYELDQWNVIEKHKTEIEAKGLRSQALSWHQYSIGVRYLRASDFAMARRYLARSFVAKMTLSNLFALVLACVRLRDAFAMRQMARILKGAKEAWTEDLGKRKSAELRLR